MEKTITLTEAHRDIIMDNYKYIINIARSVCFKCYITDYIDIHDKIQDAFLLSCDSITSYDIKKGTIKTFLTTVVKRGLFRIIMNERKHGDHEDICDYNIPSERMDDYALTNVTVDLDRDVKLMVDKALDTGMKIQELYVYFVEVYAWSWYYCKQVCQTVKNCLALT